MAHTRINTSIIAGAGLLGLIAAPVAGDCDIWVPLGAGMDGNVGHVIEYEGDLVAFGTFQTADGQDAENVAIWDGTSWQQLGDGLLTSHPQWLGLELFDGYLIATGVLAIPDIPFTISVARWDGTSWNEIGEQGCGDGAAAGGVTVFEGDLVVGLMNTTECEHHEDGFANPIEGVIRWNGEYWSQVGDTSDFSGNVEALIVFEGDLIAGDHHGAVRRWDGETWELIGQMDDRIWTFTEYNGELIAGGGFTEADGQTVNAVTRWTGESWLSMAGGMGGVTNPTVHTLQVFNGELIAGGLFNDAGGQPAERIARWTGTTWEEFEGGASGDVYALAPFGDELAVGGGFSSLGGVSASSVGVFIPCLAPPTGACCVNGACVEVDEQFCATIGGTYLGDETFCGDVDCPPTCPGDLNDDGVVDVLDLLELLGSWGPCPK